MTENSNKEASTLSDTVRSTILKYWKTSSVVVAYVAMYVYQTGYLEEFRISTGFININPLSFLEASNAMILLVLLCILVFSGLYLGTQSSRKNFSSRSAWVLRGIITAAFIFFATYTVKGTILQAPATSILQQGIYVIVILGLFFLGLYLLTLLLLRPVACVVIFIILKLKRRGRKFSELWAIKVDRKRTKDPDDDFMSFDYTANVWILMAFLYGVYGIGVYCASISHNFPAIETSNRRLYAIIQSDNGYFITELYNSKTKSLNTSSQQLFKNDDDYKVVNISVNKIR